MEFICLINGTPRNVPNMKFRVDAKEAGLVGIYRDGKPYAPDAEQFRAALPYRWRKAFDASGNVFWLQDGTEQFTVTLRGHRGAYLATVYCQPVKESA